MNVVGFFQSHQANSYSKLNSKHTNGWKFTGSGSSGSSLNRKTQFDGGILSSVGWNVFNAWAGRLRFKPVFSDLYIV